MIISRVSLTVIANSIPISLTQDLLFFFIESFEFLQSESLLDNDLSELVMGKSIGVVDCGIVNRIGVARGAVAEVIIKLHKVLFALF